MKNPNNIQFMVILQLLSGRKKIKDIIEGINFDGKEKDRKSKYFSNSTSIRNQMSNWKDVESKKGVYNLSDKFDKNKFINDFISEIEKNSYLRYDDDTFMHDNLRKRLKELKKIKLFLNFVELYLKAIGSHYIMDSREAAESFEDNLIQDYFTKKIYKKLKLKLIDDWVNDLKKIVPDGIWEHAINQAK